jgi:Kef-type K+ transport system membrane component KefB
VRELFAIAADVLAFVALPWCLWRLLGRRIPFAVLPIVAGLLLAAAGVGKSDGLLPTAFGQTVGWVGVLLLAFAAGLETRRISAPGSGHSAQAEAFSLPRLAGSALVALLLPLLAGALVARAWLLDLPGWAAANASGWLAALAIGLCIAVSALPVLVGIVREFRGEQRRLGNIALRIAVIDDAVLWTGLALLLLAAGAGAGIGGGSVRGPAAIAVLAGLLAAGRALRKFAAPPAWSLWPLAAGWLAAGSWASATLGLHELLGAYFAGAVMAPNWIARLPLERAGAFALFVLAPLFFGHSGLRIDGNALGWTALVAAAGLFVLSASAKLAAVRLCPPVAAFSRRETLAIGALLQCKGLMEIVAATILRDEGLLSEGAFAVLVALAVLSTLLTGPMFRTFAGKAAGVAGLPARPARN